MIMQIMTVGVCLPSGGSWSRWVHLIDGTFERKNHLCKFPSYPSRVPSCAACCLCTDKSLLVQNASIHYVMSPVTVAAEVPPPPPPLLFFLRNTGLLQSLTGLHCYARSNFSLFTFSNNVVH